MCKRELWYRVTLVSRAVLCPPPLATSLSPEPTETACRSELYISRTSGSAKHGRQSVVEKCENRSRLDRFNHLSHSPWQVVATARFGYYCMTIWERGGFIVLPHWDPTLHYNITLSHSIRCIIMALIQPAVAISTILCYDIPLTHIYYPDIYPMLYMMYEDL